MQKRSTVSWFGVVLALSLAAATAAAQGSTHRQDPPAAAAAAPLAAVSVAAPDSAAPAPDSTGAAESGKKKKGGGLFGKVKGVANNKVVQSVVKTAACTMVPGGQYVAGAIDAAANKSAATGAAGAATGSSCMGGLGGMGMTPGVPGGQGANLADIQAAQAAAGGAGNAQMMAAMQMQAVSAQMAHRCSRCSGWPAPPVPSRHDARHAGRRNDRRRHGAADRRYGREEQDRDPEHRLGAGNGRRLGDGYGGVPASAQPGGHRGAAGGRILPAGPLHGQAVARRGDEVTGLAAAGVGAGGLSFGPDGRTTECSAAGGKIKRDGDPRLEIVKVK